MRMSPVTALQTQFLEGKREAAARGADWGRLGTLVKGLEHFIPETQS